MSITDELRKYADDLDKKAAMKSEHGFSPIGMRLSTIADTIDAAHQREVDAARETVFSMPNHRVALPLDADGVPIHLDDEMYPVDDTPKHHSPVEFMTLTEKGWWIDGDCDPSELRHWEAPNVEDVLREFGDKACNSGHQWGLDAADTIAEYAERIREAIEHEEDK